MKYRITGLLVIISVAIIFLPPLIGKNYILEAPVEVKIPVAPRLTQDLPDIDVDKRLEEAATQPEIAPIALIDEEQPAWVLQVGSFKKIRNANALVVNLRKAGYKSYMLEYGKKPGMLYRVMVGPDLNRDAIEQQKNKIQTEKGLSGVVMKYHPLLQAGVSDELD